MLRADGGGSTQNCWMRECRGETDWAILILFGGGRFGRGPFWLATGEYGVQWYMAMQLGPRESSHVSAPTPMWFILASATRSTHHVFSVSLPTTPYSNSYCCKAIYHSVSSTPYAAEKTALQMPRPHGKASTWSAGLVTATLAGIYVCHMFAPPKARNSHRVPWTNVQSNLAKAHIISAQPLHLYVTTGRHVPHKSAPSHGGISTPIQYKVTCLSS